MKKYKWFIVVALIAALVASCAPKTVVVKETVEVEKEVEKVVTQVVKETVKETVVVAGTPKVVEKVVEKVVTPTPAPMTFKESPMLAEMVSAGDLPPLEERLPVNPIVVDAPGGEIGTYGGTATFFNMMSSARHMIFRYERLVRLSPLYGPDRQYVYEPMLADWWEVSDDTTEFTFHIREGLKWSDGVPVTSEDFRFYWQDIMQYEDLASVVGIPVIDGELEVIDDFTFKIVFAEPRGAFLLDTASAPWGYPKLEKFPAHYLKQFHPEHVSQSELDATVAEYKFDTWDQLFNNRRQWWTNPDIPQLSMWVLEREPDETGVTLWTRNPYYYKVDTEGNQLPYIDHLNGVAWETDVAVIKQIQGEIDYGYRQWRVTHYPALKQGEFKGHYKTGNETNPKATQLNLLMNQCTEDEVLRELFQDIRFRQAVSHAINREEIVDVVWNGLGEATGLTVGKYVAFWRPEWKGMYSEYDPDLANELLDEIGLAWDAAHEVRLRPDGQPLEVIYSTPGFFGGNVDAHQLFVEYVAAIGIKVIWKTQTGEAHQQWASSNESQWVDDSFFVDEGSSGHFVSGGRGNWCNLWGDWLTSDGAEGLEPPERVKEIYEWKVKGDNANTMEERIEAYGEAMDRMVRQLNVIGIAGHDVRPSTIHERLKNVRQDMYLIGVNPMVALYPANFVAPETWYLDQNWTP